MGGGGGGRRLVELRLSLLDHRFPPIVAFLDGLALALAPLGALTLFSPPLCGWLVIAWVVEGSFGSWP